MIAANESNLYYRWRNFLTIATGYNTIAYLTSKHHP